jgi:hypothetical protein
LLASALREQGFDVVLLSQELLLGQKLLTIVLAKELDRI